jgi:hypothetical protein
MYAPVPGSLAAGFGHSSGQKGFASNWVVSPTVWVVPNAVADGVGAPIETAVAVTKIATAIFFVTRRISVLLLIA